MSDYDRYINITTLGNDDEEVIDGMLKAGLSARQINDTQHQTCLLYTSPSPRDS